MEKFELILTTNEAGEIVTNIADLTEQVLPLLKKYNYIVTPENMAQAKKEVTAIRKVETEIANERKRTEKNLMAGFAEAKAQLMGLEKKLEACAANLNEGVKAIEAEEKQKKKDMYEAIWNDRIHGLVSFEKIYNPKWLNKSAKKADVEAALDMAAEKIMTDWHNITPYLTGDEDADAAIRQYFFQTLDMARTIAKCTEYRNLLEKRAAAEAARKAAEAAAAPTPANTSENTGQRLDGPETASEPVLTASEVNMNQPEPQEAAPEMILKRFRWVTEGTEDQYKYVWAAMKQCGLKILGKPERLPLD